MAAFQANNTGVPAEDKIRDSEIGYFQPDLHKPYGSDDPVTVGSDPISGTSMPPLTT